MTELAGRSGLRGSPSRRRAERLRAAQHYSFRSLWIRVTCWSHPGWIVCACDADQIPVRDAQSWIAPLRVPRGCGFHYRMQVEMEGVDSGGIERIAILTQWPADVDWNAISSTGQASVDAVRSYVTDDSRVVYFSPPVGETAELTVPFTAACSQLSTASLLSYTRPNRRNPRRTNGRADA